MSNILQQIIGYVAMTLLVVSFIPKKMKLVRTINLIACSFFVAWGLMLGIDGLPIVISNLAVCGVQIYHLFFAKEKAESEIIQK